jgi:hypothetical protein
MSAVILSLPDSYKTSFIRLHFEKQNMLRAELLSGSSRTFSLSLLNSALLKTSLVVDVTGSHENKT